jgi:hypothetical protein
MTILAPAIQLARQATSVDPLTTFYHQLQAIPAVEALYANWHPDGLEVWLVVYQASADDRQSIFAQELALMHSFPGLGVDTHLIDRAEAESSLPVDLSTVDAFLRFTRPAHA